MKKNLIIIFIIFSQAIFADEKTFEKGNNKYNTGEYSKAISIYESILDNNFISAEIYYNLGNCYFKKNDWKNAIWYYEKSLELKKDKKTKKNLELSQLNIKDKIEPIPEIFYIKWWKSFVSLYSLKTWQISTIVFFWILLLINLLKFLKRTEINLLKNYIITLCFLLSLITYSSYYFNNKNFAIIFSNSTIVNSAPSTESTSLFTLHAGSKIEIIDRIDGWINIKIQSGNSGWIEAEKCKNL